MLNGISSLQSGQVQGNGQKQNNMESELKKLGVPQEIITQGRDAVKEYCDENNITLPKPPQKPEGESLFENKRSQGQQNNAKEPPAEFLSQLASSGVPADIISQGPEAVMTYCQENNITLPKPPERQEGQLDLAA